MAVKSSDYLVSTTVTPNLLIPRYHNAWTTLQESLYQVVIWGRVYS